MTLLDNAKQSFDSPAKIMFWAGFFAIWLSLVFAGGTLGATLLVFGVVLFIPGAILTWKNRRAS
jgi:hypothetical protein